jgi:hypothetical protein
VPFEVLLPVAVFLAMGVVVVLGLWRVVVVGGEARRTAQSFRLASDVAHRAESCLADLGATVDDLRHRRLEPQDAVAPLAAATATLTGYTAEARLAVGRAGSPIASGLVEDLERAQRSLELIEHGRQLLETEGRGAGEGETAIKRGYLNLLHAREALKQRGADIRASAMPRRAARNLN